jgi:hypothetical protein
MAAKSRAEAMKAVEAIFERYDDDFLVQSLGYSICSSLYFSVLFELTSKIRLPLRTPLFWPPNRLIPIPIRASQTNNTGTS